ncbi:MAG: 30S ribosome-binding factor RbfA [Gemmatimonadales bacterium]|nr:MAG: 30S ribosome-binding factor RbfA [Gemmatimonadales bacterium]
MSGRRLERVNRVLREELARLVLEELKDPRVAGVTFTKVETSLDLSHARITVRTLPGDVPVEEAIEGLDRASGFIRRRLGRELHCRKAPELHFVQDHTLEHARRIDELLDEAFGRGGDASE